MASSPPYTVMTPTSLVGSPSFVMGLTPGDVVLYSRTSLFNRLIAVKTWSRFTHVEVVASKPTPGIALMAASRNGTGVNFYTADWRGCALVLRPSVDFDAMAANTWASTVVGQRYDWLGLLNFTYARLVGDDNGKMFCSEFAARYLRRGGLCDAYVDGAWRQRDLFPEQDADTIAPRDFTVTAALRVVWRTPEEWMRWTDAQARARWA